MDGDLLDALELGLRRLAGVPVPHDAWQPDKVPEHLKMNFRVLDESGAVVGEGRDLAQLQRELSSRIRESLAQALPSQAGLRDWTVGTLPQTVEQIRAGYRVTGYPALVDEGDSVAVRVFETAAEQRIAHRAGVRRLLRLALPAPATVVQGRLDNAAKLALLRSPHGNVNALLDDCADCAVDALMPQPPWDEAGYRANTSERCFFCKDELFTKLAAVRLEAGMDWLADGVNVDDDESRSSFCSSRILIAPERSSANCATRWIDPIRSSARTITNLLLNRKPPSARRYSVSSSMNAARRRSSPTAWA